MKEQLLTILRKFQPAHLLTALFIGFMIFVGAAAFPTFLKNTVETLQTSFDLNGYIKKIDQQYSSMLETDNDYPVLQDKGSYIDLNGFMANLLDQPMMNDRVTLKNGHLTSTKSESPDPDKIRQAANNIIRFREAHADNGGDFLFVMVPSQVSKYEDLLPIGYTDTTNATADAFLSQLKQAGVPILDLRERLEEDGISVTDAYYTTDHHWTPQTGFWAFRQMINTLTNMEIINAIDPFYTDPKNYRFETYENTFLGSSGKRTGKYFAGLDDSILIKPNFETDISVSVSQRSISLEGPYEEVAYNTDISPDYDNPNFFNENIYGSFGWGDTKITHWRNEHAAIQKKFLLIGESFGNIPFSLMSLCFSSCDEVDLRHFDKDFTSYYYEYQPDVVILEFNISAIFSDFTSHPYLG